jgi:putative glutamine amidotransferase
MARTTRPTIAIFRDFPSSKSRESSGFFDVVQSVGGLPMLGAQSAKETELQACLERAQGVILDGGPDMDPVAPAASACAIVRQAMERQLPLLAIAQGMQQLNAAAGGTLYPPGELQPDALAHSKPRHAVLLETGTRLEEIYERDEIWVDNDHRQAIRRVGQGLRVSGLAPDGIIEAIEAADPTWFCLGIQWRPKISGPVAPDLRLFESLVAACLRCTRAPALATRSETLAVSH